MTICMNITSSTIKENILLPLLPEIIWNAYCKLKKSNSYIFLVIVLICFLKKSSLLPTFVFFHYQINLFFIIYLIEHKPPGKFSISVSTPRGFLSHLSNWFLLLLESIQNHILYFNLLENPPSHLTLFSCFGNPPPYSRLWEETSQPNLHYIFKVFCCFFSSF